MTNFVTADSGSCFILQTTPGIFQICSDSVAGLLYKSFSMILPGIGPVYIGKSCPGQEGPPQAESTLVSVYERKELIPLPKSRAGCACSDRFARTVI